MQRLRCEKFRQATIFTENQFTRRMFFLTALPAVFVQLRAAACVTVTQPAEVQLQRSTVMYSAGAGGQLDLYYVP